jgi:hypothetical protein
MNPSDYLFNAYYTMLLVSETEGCRLVTRLMNIDYLGRGKKWPSFNLWEGLWVCDYVVLI